jgi:uncharacterized protein
MRKVLLLVSLVFVVSAAAFAQSEKQTRAGHFAIQKTEQGRFYFVLKSSNGQGVLTGYFYSTEDKVKEAIDKVKLLVADDANFDLRSSGQQWYFFLKSKDGRAVAQSEHYTTETAMKKGVEAVKRTAPDAAVRSMEN